MNNRNKLITTILLTISLILSTTMPVMAEEITDEIVEVQSVNEEASICSDEEDIPSHSIILVNGYYVLNVPWTYATCCRRLWTRELSRRWEWGMPHSPGSRLEEQNQGGL